VEALKRSKFFPDKQIAFLVFSSAPSDTQIRLLADAYFFPRAPGALVPRVEHNTDLRRAPFFRFSRLNHQESPAVPRNVIVWTRRRCRQEPSLEQDSGFDSAKTCLAGDIHDHHLISAAIKQFPPVRIPHGHSVQIRWKRRPASGHQEKIEEHFH
jgi:hypothetical protein